MNNVVPMKSRHFLDVIDDGLKQCMEKMNLSVMDVWVDGSMKRINGRYEFLIYGEIVFRIELASNDTVIKQEYRPDLELS